MKKKLTKKSTNSIISECQQLEAQLCQIQTKRWEHLSKDNQLFSNEENTSMNSNANLPTIDPIKVDSVGAKIVNPDEITQSLYTCNLSCEITDSTHIPLKKRNRQKERLARRAAEREAAVEEARQEAAKQPDTKFEEHKKILEQCEAEGLIEKSIRPDGHCLFSAVADQLIQIGIPLGNETNGQPGDQLYKIVRESAAKYIDGHPEDFVAWLDEPLSQYVDKIRNTAEWGGHLELLALARYYNVKICIIQDGNLQTIEPLPDSSKIFPKIWMAYYRRRFGLGEHYNSLRAAS